MLLLSKHKHPLTAVTLLALVASTSLSWSRWSKGDDTFLYLSERRGLSADQEQHVPDQDNVYERNYQSLVAKGHDPNSVSFQRILDRRIGRRMDKVSTNQVKRVRNNDTRKLRSKSFIRSRVRELLSKHEAQEHINIVMGLKNTRDIWKRGDFLKTNTPGLWLSNAHLSEEEVMKGALADGTRVVSFVWYICTTLCKSSFIMCIYLKLHKHILCLSITPGKAPSSKARQGLQTALYL